MEAMPVRPPFTEQDLLDAAGNKSYGRGEGYLDAVANLTEEEPGYVTAVVYGNDTYAVVLEYGADGLTGDCDCPYGEQGYFCKHCVAVGLAFLRSATARPVEAAETAAFDLRAYLASLDPHELVDLLDEAARSDPDLRRRLTLRAARTDCGAGPDITSIREHLGRALRTYGYLDRRGAHAYAEAVADVSETLRELHEGGHHTAVMDLSGRALALIGSALGEIDDSDGGITDEGEVLVELHAEACAAAPPDPAELADWLLAFQLANHDWPELALRDYTEPLGETGITHYAARLRAVQEDRAGRDDHRWLIQHLREDLAKVREDTDAQVEALADNLTHGYAYLRIAEVLTAADRKDEALSWAERGFAEYPNESRLADHLTQRYSAAGRHADTLKIRWEQFRHQPSVALHNQVLEAARAIGELDHYRAETLRLLREAAGETPTGTWAARVLIDVLLAEEHFDQAWKAAETLGANRDQWLRLAEVCQTTRPAEALAIYVREAAALIKTMGNDAYARAADLLARAREMSRATGHEPEWQEHFTKLRTEHHRKRNLTTQLTRRGLI
ncbi:SWIM zinc finger domain-containing protein [Embleya sp. NPDC050493]|uniref:SWIM zinc finger domain-containing protein n=1 Tax=Embleya sp. NPDC050493 TaxID=3363989 RepID=UPI0037B4E6B7